METKKQKNHTRMQLWLLESALRKGYSIQGRRKEAIREITIHRCLHEQNPPFVTASSSKTIEEALLRAAENYEKWSLGQEQINFIELDGNTVDTSEPITKGPSLLDILLSKGHTLELFGVEDGIQCKIYGFQLSNSPGVKEGKGRSIVESIKKTLQKPPKKM